MATDLPGASSTGVPELSFVSPVSHSPDPKWIKALQSHFAEWVLGPIRRLVPSQDWLVGFILMSCAIDYLAGFWWGRSTQGSVKEAYTGFINTFFPAGRYDAEGLYDSLRNGLVHMFTIKGRKYALTHDAPERHLKSDEHGQIILNAADFEVDLVIATKAYFSAAESSPEFIRKAQDRYFRDWFLGPSPLHME